MLWTEKENRSGLDFSKTVVIEDLNFIEARKPYIRKREFDSLRGKEYIVRAKLLKYISDYRRAKAETNIPRNALLCKCSALQYFDKYLERQAGDCP